MSQTNSQHWQSQLQTVAARDMFYHNKACHITSQHITSQHSIAQYHTAQHSTSLTLLLRLRTISTTSLAKLSCAICGTSTTCVAASITSPLASPRAFTPADKDRYSQSFSHSVSQSRIQSFRHVFDEAYRYSDKQVDMQEDREQGTERKTALHTFKDFPCRPSHFGQCVVHHHTHALPLQQVVQCLW
jgi:hypothetical protein